MITYEHVKLLVEIVAFVSLTGALYLLIALRGVLKDILGTSTIRGVYIGGIIFWFGYLINVLNDVLTLRFLKILDDIVVAIGMVVIAYSTIWVKRQIVTRVKPRVVLEGESGLQSGAYLTKPMHPPDLLRLLSGKKLFAVTRSPQIYESLNVPYIWITNIDHPKAISPTRLAPLLHAIVKGADDNTFVILDGLHYLIVQNGFEATIKFLVSLKDALSEKSAGILLIVDPETLEKRHLAILEREFKWILR
ncbi:DUF835 domain-containing protein [Thermococcus thioreducens]|uniref:DUF835 domain-containing protein n=1 Tax=Thermococcus thioreducens TaxID=277988 RepID=A0A0Q2QQU7_9EURY|nr:DUF835 domain-containing protein [Thermococcus thioreducens]ASJ12886.1 hypothetical protein A3L14_08315 [Thermococcus thioreducens]KQH82349.1 hypothetical protein AMR53_07075 [Thermococcus thioreducens]SEV83827.1 Protein of unknown function [Thermococcus thioreducens]